jgi:hypothetical protein
MVRQYDHELERVRLRAMLAIERLERRGDTAGSAHERMSQELSRIDAALADEQLRGRAAALAERLGLVDDELDLLWTAVAVAADPRVQPHARVLGGVDARRGLSLATYAVIADLGGSRARALGRRLLASHPLFADGILGWSDDRDALAARIIVAPSRTISWLAGLDEPDPNMAGASRTVSAPSAVELDTRQRSVLETLARLLASTAFPLIIVEGASGSGRATAVAKAAGGRDVIALDLRRLPRGLAVLESALVALRRECRLRDAIPVLGDAEELLGPVDEGLTRVVARAIDGWKGPFVVTATVPELELAVTRTVARVRWPVPDVATRRALWNHATGEDTIPSEMLDGLAMRFRLGAGGIGRAVATARLHAGDAAPSTTHLTAGVRANIAERLGELAVRIDVAQGWNDLVLPPDLLDQVHSLIARVRHAHAVLEGWGYASKVARGGGVAALFSGPPGTGKTMVAGLIARELDLELYQVDLSRVVSKWVGETEKQLARVFEAAEAGHALLLFDEADALFARRTEVKSSNDRFANLEVNYLLQRIESFGGLTILTTNNETAIDPALKRRLASHIAFWPPDADERARLWCSFITPQAPFAGALDADKLAEQFPEMTGANIRNAVVAAAFLAAGEGHPMSQQHLERAGRGEYIAMGRLISTRRL